MKIYHLHKRLITGVIWLHIRAVGKWTEILYNHFLNKINSNKSSSELQKTFKIRSPVFIYPFETNVDESNAESLALFTLNHMAMPTYSGKIMAALDYNSTKSRRLSMRFEETKSQMFTKYEVITMIDKPFVVRLDGSYGTPSRQIFDSQHAVLVATGIGVRIYGYIE
jgi:hypothetical protein